MEIILFSVFRIVVWDFEVKDDRIWVAAVTKEAIAQNIHECSQGMMLSEICIGD